MSAQASCGGIFAFAGSGLPQLRKGGTGLVIKMKPGEFFAHKVQNYLTRIFNTDPACRTALLVLTASLLSPVTSVLAVIAGGIYLLCSRKRCKRLVSDKLNFFLWAFLIVVLAVSLIHQNYIGVAATIFLVFCLIIMMQLRAVITRRFFEDLITAYLGYSVVAVLVAAIERLIHISDPMYRTCSTFLNPLYYAYFVTFAAIFCTYRLVVSPRSKAAHSLVLLLNICGMLFSGGRMPWIGMFAGTLIVLMLCRRYRLFIAFCIGFGMLAAIAFWFPDLEFLAALRLNSINSGYAGRVPYWSMAFDGFEQQPLFGHGMLGILNASIQQGDWLARFFETWDLGRLFADMKGAGFMLHAHNLLFDALYNFGIIGTLLLGFCILRYCSAMYRNFSYHSYNPMIALIVGIIVSILINGIVDAEIIGLQTSVFTILIFAMTGLREEQIYPEPPAQKPLRDLLRRSGKKQD